MSKSIQIFKPGKHTAMSGASLSFTESDLAACVAAYDPAKHEAPIVVGHPKHDSPAYGWVKSLAFADGAMEAEPHQVDPAFAEMFATGRFKKISSSFYAPDSPSNPVPGVYYLRHVGCLGAQPPAIKGLRNPEFADSEEGVIEFADWGGMQNASLWRRLRDWLIGEKGLETADSIIPDYAVQNLEQEANKSDTAEVVPSPAFTEHQPEGETMSDADKAQLAALQKQVTDLTAENAALKTKAVEFAEAEKTRIEADKKRATDARHVEHASFCEGLIKAGKLLPAKKDETIALMDSLGAQESVVEFGEGDGKQSKSPLVLYRAQLDAMPVQVDFAERGADGGESLDTTDAEAISKAAVEFMESESKAGRTVSATAAVQHVTKGSK